ncbi:hypothetical protein BDBG_02728 [Paecilomyces variotii No. 5]|uniref:F-box domain-containing protein n=1 Tax=Byssochlamys spectabilis (strain No. 5 / NBRC 109023) TaxID=1356009 RepID=V5FZ04_BYSSN|nr:hypothetical protein BDBG_02728 [Paecilomyces variotii No. 5]
MVDTVLILLLSIIVAMVYAYLVRKITAWIMELLEALEFLTIGEHDSAQQEAAENERRLERRAREARPEASGPPPLPCALPGWDTGNYKNGRHPFFTLPTELVLLITSFVSAEEKAALALTCKHLLYVLGNDSVRMTNDRTEQDEYAHVTLQLNRWKLLKLIENDFQNHFVCHTCAHFHLNLPIKPSYVSFYPPASLCITRTNIFFRGVWGWCVGYEKVHGLMMAHRNKWPYAASLDDFKYEKRFTMSKFRLRILREGTTAETIRAIAPSPDDEDDEIECHETVSATISCNELLLDIRATFFVDREATSLEEYVVNERCPNHGVDVLGDLTRLRKLGSSGRVCLECATHTDIRIWESTEKPEMDEIRVWTMISLGSGEESSKERWDKACRRRIRQG